MSKVSFLQIVHDGKNFSCKGQGDMNLVGKALFQGMASNKDVEAVVRYAVDFYDKNPDAVEQVREKIKAGSVRAETIPLVQNRAMKRKAARITSPSKPKAEA